MPRVQWWPQARKCLRTHPLLGEVVQATAPDEGLVVEDDLMMTYVRIVTAQQVATAVAHTMAANVHRACEMAEHEALAERLLALGSDGLRALGLSHTKAGALVALAQGHQRGELTRQALTACGKDELSALLRRVRGIGPWSVEMVRIFGLGEPDVLALTDYGVRQALVQLAAPEVDARTFAPFGTAATWYLWRLRQAAQPL